MKYQEHDTIQNRQTSKCNHHAVRNNAIQNIREKNDDQTKKWEEFQQEGLAEAEQKIKEIKEQADFHIDNNGTLVDLYKQIDEIIEKIRN
jgi:dephospho-CoA kinase